jgi:pyruvate formate lyase activating enzyme
MNIDLKSIRNEFYVKYCNGGLETVKQTIINAYNFGIHIELTNLLIPTLNDAEEDIRDLIDFVASVSIDIPLHFSAYYPAYKSNIPPTPSRIVLRACQLAKEKLSYVYAGNIWSDEFKETYCPKCHNLVISAQRRIVGIDDKGQCNNCSYKIYGVF